MELFRCETAEKSGVGAIIGMETASLFTNTHMIIPFSTTKNELNEHQ